jgi:hypothetical protein
MFLLHSRSTVALVGTVTVQTQWAPIYARNTEPTEFRIRTARCGSVHRFDAVGAGFRDWLRRRFAFIEWMRPVQSGLPATREFSWVGVHLKIGDDRVMDGLADKRRRKWRQYVRNALKRLLLESGCFCCL